MGIIPTTPRQLPGEAIEEETRERLGIPRDERDRRAGTGASDRQFLTLAIIALVLIGLIVLGLALAGLL